MLRLDMHLFSVMKEGSNPSTFEYNCMVSKAYLMSLPGAQGAVDLAHEKYLQHILGYCD